MVAATKVKEIKGLQGQLWWNTEVTEICGKTLIVATVQPRSMRIIIIMPNIR